MLYFLKEKKLGEKSREYLAAWLSSHKPNFVVIHTEKLTNFFKFPAFLGMEQRGKNYIFSLHAFDGTTIEVELSERFNVFCIDKYTEWELSIVDMRTSIEIIEKYQKVG